MPPVLKPLAFGLGNLAAHTIRKDNLGNGNWAKYFFSGAIAGSVVGTSMIGTSIPQAIDNINFLASVANGIFGNNKQWFNNYVRVTIGNYYLDENKTFGGQILEGISRFTWEYPQQMLGYAWSSIMNYKSDRVDYFGGATFVTDFRWPGVGGVTLGSFINIEQNTFESEKGLSGYGSLDKYIVSSEHNAQFFYAHEYGHYIQSKEWGLLYLPVPALSSFINAIENNEAHENFWVERFANTLSRDYFYRYYLSI